MPHAIAEYYLEELVDWNRLVAFYDNELAELGNKLAEVIQRNTIPNIAAKVEKEQDKLNVVALKFHQLGTQIRTQLTTLKTDSTVIDDKLIKKETEKQQNELRRNMQLVEKEYVDTKYDCYNFLSGTLRK